MSKQPADVNVRGVNLGGWLVLEKWITPSVFKSVKANEEYWLCKELGDQAEPLLNKHRKSFITEKDFIWLKNSGINAVRIPVGHWVFGDVPTYVGCIEFLDWAMQSAEKHGLAVLIDLHAAAGSQNSWDHSGSSGILGWHTNKEHINQALSVVKRLSERYRSSPAFWGIELLNEPHALVPKHILLDYYWQGYETVRQVAGSNPAVVVSDAFRPLEVASAVSNMDLTNCVLDVHLYQLFTDKYKAMSYAEHIDTVLGDWFKELSDIQQLLPCLVGEWSAVLPGAAYAELSGSQKGFAERAYVSAQQAVFAGAAGWFYWTYKTEANDSWDFRAGLSKGLFGL